MKSANMMANPTLLIVDDDEGIRTQLKWGLEGFDIITADSREKAIQQFEKYQPNLVTLDLGLPPDVEGTSEGFAILAALLERNPDATIVVVSASDREINTVKARQNGAYDFYAKPVEIESLQKVLNRAYSEKTST